MSPEQIRPMLPAKAFGTRGLPNVLPSTVGGFQESWALLGSPYDKNHDMLGLLRKYQGHLVWSDCKQNHNMLGHVGVFCGAPDVWKPSVRG